MPGKITKQTRYDSIAKTLFQALTTAGSTTDPVKLSFQISVQLTGPATDVTIQIERSTNNPATGANWSPVDSPIIGNPSTGINVSGFVEPAAAWWRAKCTAITGDHVDVAISGGGA